MSKKRVADLTPKQLKKRRAQNRVYAQKWRAKNAAKMTPEEREAEKARWRAWHAGLSEDQREAYRAKARAWWAKKSAKMTQRERARKREEARKRYKPRSKMTPHELLTARQHQREYLRRRCENGKVNLASRRTK
jgi:hypothetical protein